MAEASVIEHLTTLFGGRLLWLAVAAMTILGSLAGVFTFCVRRYTHADDAVSRRKKTDEISPDDRVLRPQANDSDRLEDTRLTANKTETQLTGEDGRTCVEVASENGVYPVIKETMDSMTTNGLSEHREGEAPAINEEKQKGQREVKQNGIEELNRRAGIKHPDNEPTPVVIHYLPNGVSEDHTHQEVIAVNGDVAMVNGTHKKARWSFPPQLEDFDLMETDADPAELEQIFADERLVEINLELDSDSPGLGISIVGGSGSPSGDLPIIIKRVLPNSLAERDGRLKSGDELIAVDDTLLVGVAKDTAIETLSNISGNVRLLVLQDD